MVRLLPAVLLAACATTDRGPTLRPDDTPAGPGTGAGATGGPPPPNLLVVIADDVGADQLAVSGAADPIPTPVIDALAADAVRFTTAYASPNCSPTRAELLTGRYNHRSGVTNALDPSGSVALPDGEWTLPEALRDVGYATALVGKWHLGNEAVGPDHPRTAGFDHFRGSLGNLDDDTPPVGEPGYENWQRVVDGVPGWTTTYATTATVDDALALLAELPEPWLLVVSFNAGHAPWHAPPPELIGGTLAPGAPVAAAYQASVVALDTELGRLVAGIDLERAVVAFAGDNGTPREIIGWPAKSSAYEHGVRVPFFVRGPGFSGRDVPQMVPLVDLYPTLLDLAGAPPGPSPLDGASLLAVLRDGAIPTHDLVFAGRSDLQTAETNLSRMVRGPRYKLIHEVNDVEGEDWSLFDLLTDPTEGVDLLDAPLTGDAAASHDALRVAYDAVLAPL